MKGRKRKIRQIYEGELVREFQDLDEAARQYENYTTAKTNICRACREFDRGYKAYGYNWQYGEISEVQGYKPKN